MRDAKNSCKSYDKCVYKILKVEKPEETYHPVYLLFDSLLHRLKQKNNFVMNSYK